MTRNLFLASLLMATAAATICRAATQAPTAIVEDIVGNPPGIELMDYVEPGKVLQLGPNDGVVLSYFSSCVREAIQGGSVRIGFQQSAAATGKIERVKVDCDAAQMLRVSGQTTDSASLIVRAVKAQSNAPPPPAQFRIFGVRPVFQLSGEGELIVERVDVKGESFTLDVREGLLTKGRFLDFATLGKSLTAGGVYATRWNGRVISFLVDKNARRDQTPVVGRLIRIDP